MLPAERNGIKVLGSSCSIPLVLMTFHSFFTAAFKAFLIGSPTSTLPPFLSLSPVILQRGGPGITPLQAPSCALSAAGVSDRHLLRWSHWPCSYSGLADFLAVGMLCGQTWFTFGSAVYELGVLGKAMSPSEPRFVHLSNGAINSS